MSKKYLPPAIISLLFLAVVFYFYSSVIANTNDRYVYPLDDTYIHLAVAKNWVQSGVPGVNAGEFVYLTSSPLWTSSVAFGNLIFGENDLLPIYLNIALAVFLIFYIAKVLSNYLTNSKSMILLLLLIIFSLSLPLLVLIGMEHLLHSILMLIFLLQAYKLRDNVGHTQLYALAFILASVRFESLFAIGIIAIWLIFNKKIKRGLLLVASGLLPVLIFGIYSLMQGGTFLPTSILLKGEFFGNEGACEFIKSLLWHPVKKLSSSLSLSVLFITALALIYRMRKDIFSDKTKSLLLFFVLITAAHLLFAQVGWLYRYEAYLILSGTIIIIINLAAMIDSGEIRQTNFSKFLIVLLFLPLLLRAYDTNSSINRASVNIYEQQWQMANFFSRYYPQESIAVNDIGLVSYGGNVKVFDLWGLANWEIAHLRMNNDIDGEKLDFLMSLNKVKIAAVYKQWFDYPKGFYRDWVEVGSWTIQNNIACGEPQVVFFTKDSLQMLKLVKNLIDYSSSLPENVIKKINY